MLPFSKKKEFLAITAGFGVVVSSGITLVVRLLVITGTRARSFLHVNVVDLLPALNRERDPRTRIWHPKPRPLQLAPPAQLRLTGTGDLRHVRPRGLADRLQGRITAALLADRSASASTPEDDDDAILEPRAPRRGGVSAVLAATAVRAAAATATAAHGTRTPHPESSCSFAFPV